MATTYRSSSSANTGTTAATTLQIGAPAGIQVGDVLLAAINSDGTPSFTASSDWTLVRSTNQATAPSSKMTLYFRLVTGYEAWPYTWTLGSAKQASGVIVAYSGTSGLPPTTANSTSSATAATSLTSSNPNTTWSGLELTFWGTRNTTGVSTITAEPSGWTNRVDTCTTATPFVETEAQESPGLTLPAVTLLSLISTASQFVTSIGINVFLDDAHSNVPLCLDDIYKTTWAAAQTTATNNVSTNYPNELVVACVLLETGASLSVSSVTASGLTFVQLTNITTQGGDCEIWYAIAPTPISGTVVTATFSSTTSGSFCTFGIVGIDLTNTTGSSAFGATATASSASSGTATVNLTTTRSNSWVFALCNSSNSNKVALGAGSGQTMYVGHSNSTTSSGAIFLQNTPTAASGAVVTMSTTSAVVTDWNILAFEILASRGHGLSSGMAGS